MGGEEAESVVAGLQSNPSPFFFTPLPPLLSRYEPSSLVSRTRSALPHRVDFGQTISVKQSHFATQTHTTTESRCFQEQTQKRLAGTESAFFPLQLCQLTSCFVKFKSAIDNRGYIPRNFDRREAHPMLAERSSSRSLKAFRSPAMCEGMLLDAQPNSRYYLFSLL